MKELTEAQKLKEQCLAELREALPRYAERLERIDGRVWEYAQDVVRADIDIHNLDEILGFRKFLRLLDTYVFDYELLKDILYDAEGLWENISNDNDNENHNGSGWRHVRGGLKIDGIFGYTYYRQTRMQVMTYAWIYGFQHDVDTQSPIGSREMLQTERAGENGTIIDTRRLVRSFILLWPRKMAKTFTGAFVQFDSLLHGERDAQNYIASNSSMQSQVLWGMCDKFVTQLDGWQRYFRRSDNDQHRFLKFKRNNPMGRSAEVTALSAGAKTKDGLKASVITADEFGAAQRTRGNAADMEKLINVLEGSQGPIREPLTLHTSTAGLGLETPYELMINAVHESLKEEMLVPLDGQPHKTENDWQGCILLRPDEWERKDEAALRSERVIRKVNPNVGITIQPDYYKNEWKKADLEGEVKKKEVVTKLYNIFCSDRAVDWITGDEVRKLMTDTPKPQDTPKPPLEGGDTPKPPLEGGDTPKSSVRSAPLEGGCGNEWPRAKSKEPRTKSQDEWPRAIEDCKAKEGWVVLTGMDFTNVGDDFQAATYLAVRRGADKRMRFFVEFEAWVSEEAVQKSPYMNLFRQWADEGYLHIIPGKTLSSSLLVDRVVSLRNEHGVNMLGFGYDPFKAKEAVNTLKVWIASFGVKPDQLQNYIMPVSQTYGAVSPVLEEVTYLIREEEPMIRFAYSPLVPFEFGNCRVAESSDGYENKRIVKSKDEAKIDNCQAMLNAFSCYDKLSGMIAR